MKLKLMLGLFVVLVLGAGLRAMTQPPADAPPAFREYCAGRCHISPTSVLSGKRRAFLAWGKLSRVDRGLKLCTMGLNLYEQSRDHYDPSRKGIPIADNNAILAYLDHYLGPPPQDEVGRAFAVDQ